MIRLRVIAEKLNIRNSPVADINFVNWIGDSLKGEMHFAEKKVKGEIFEGIDDWYIDGNNRFYWAGGFEEVVRSPLLENMHPANRWWFDNYNIEGLWNETKGEGVTVAVLDSGIDTKNSTLAAKIDFKNSYNYKDLNQNITDEYSHGTHCAGLIASDGFEDFSGIAPNATLIVAKVMKSNSLNSSVLIDALRAIIKLPQVDIISMSLEIIQYNDELNQVFEEAVLKHNKIIICANGNSNSFNPERRDVYPAKLSLNMPIISIGSFESDNKYSSFNLLNIPTVCCPGNKVYSYLKNGSKAEHSGSSQSAAIGAGIASLMVSYMKKMDKKITPTIVKELMLQSSFQIQDTTYQLVFNRFNPVHIITTINQLS